MRRVGTIAFYTIGVLAIAYLALYGYVRLTGRQFVPGDPIRIFRRPDAPSYSLLSPPGRSAANASSELSVPKFN